MNGLMFTLLLFVAVGVIYVAQLLYARRRNVKPEGWMHLCSTKGRYVWFPYGSKCIFCGGDLDESDRA